MFLNNRENNYFLVFYCKRGWCGFALVVLFVFFFLSK